MGFWRFSAVIVLLCACGGTAQADVFSARELNALALKEGGTVAAWGNNAYGAYGNSRVLQHPFPHRVSQLPAITQVWGNVGSVFALDGSRRVWAWGDNSRLQLGERDTAENAVPGRILGLSDVVQVGGGSAHAVALRADGTVWVWGAQTAFGAATTRPRRIEGISSVTAIASGANHVLMLKQDGSVWAAGDNTYAVFGASTPASSASAVPVPGMTGVVRIWAAGARCFALKSDGALWDWGISTSGPAALPLTGRATAVRGFTPDPSTEIFIATDAGKVYRFPRRGGSAPRGPPPRYGGTVDPTPTPTTTTREMPVEVPAFTGAVFVAPGFNGFGLPNDFWVALFPGGRLMTQGGNLQGQLGDGTYADMPSPGFGRPLIDNVIDAAAMVRSVVALRSDGSVWVWGSNGRAQQADGVNPSPTTPYAPNLSDVVSVSAGGLFSVVRRSDGSVWAWGENLKGQLCDGTRVSRSTPAPITTISGVAEVVASESAIAFLKQDGSVSFCGWLNGYVNAVPDEHLTPRAITGLPPITKIFASRHTVFALDGSNRLWAFGSYAYGNFGPAADASSEKAGCLVGSFCPPPYSLTPVQVTGISGTIVHIAGADHVLAVTSDGNVWSWGRNDAAQLGRATTGSSDRTPQLVPGVSQARKAGAGTYHSLALRQDGSLMVWGKNDFGQLGLGDTSNRATAVSLTDLAGFDDVAASENASYARRTDGTVYAWGRNEQHLEAETLGDGTYVTRTLPSILLREGGAGRLDTNDWYLDLKPSAAKSIPAAKIPRVLAVAEGSTEGDVTVNARVTFKQADTGKNVGIYVVGLVPPAFLGQVPRAPGTGAFAASMSKADSGLVLVQLTPQGWSVVTGSLSALVQGVTSSLENARAIVRGVPAPTIPGARFCIGYAEGGTALLENVDLREVARVPGALGTATQTGPCVFTGAYLTGPSSSSAGSATTFQASIVGVAPTGTMSLLDGASLMGTQAVTGSSLAVRSATFTTSSLGAGTHSLTASYAGDGSNPASTSAPLTHTVGFRAGTTTTLSGPSTSQAGSSVTLVATVSSATATGSVRFTEGATLLGVSSVSGGTANLVLSGLSTGSHTITAEYEGDANHAGSTSPGFTHSVTAAPPLTLSLSASNRRSRAGDTVTLTATASGGNLPSGTVRFVGPRGTIGNATLASNVATFNVSSLPAGVNTVYAELSASGSNPAVTSIPVAIDVVPVVNDVALSVTIGGMGTVTSTPAGINCSTECVYPWPAGTTVTLSVTPATGYIFTGWSGGGCSGTSPCAITLDSHTAVAASFVAAGQGLNASTGGVSFTGPSSQAVTLTNSTGAEIAITHATAPRAFTVSHDCGTLANGASCTLSIGFTPAPTGNSGHVVVVYARGAERLAHTPLTVAGPAAAARLANISTRMQVLTGNDVMIGGFIIVGSTPKTVVVRARGPSLALMGVPGTLSDPVLNLYSGQTVIASNDDWRSATNMSAIQASGFAPLDNLESAILVTLNPGAYTAIVSGYNGGTGVGIVEVFEVDRPETPLINIATRGKVQTGDHVMIGGFIIYGETPRTVVVRARGPSLTAAGVPGVLANPVLNLYSGQTVIASNDNWQSASNAATLQASGFAPADPLESAVLITLNPGAYTAIVTGAGGATGVGIVEVFAQ